MSSLTWPQVVLVAVILFSVIIAVKVAPEAVTPVTSLAFAVIGSALINKQPKKDEQVNKDASSS